VSEALGRATWSTWAARGTFDPGNNVRRQGRILTVRGRDAADVAIATAFGPSELVGFKVVTDAVSE
jgi:hypothetical protein